MSVLDVETDLDWNPSVSTINSSPLAIYDDGAILYFKYQFIVMLYSIIIVAPIGTPRRDLLNLLLRGKQSSKHKKMQGSCSLLLMAALLYVMQTEKV